MLYNLSRHGGHYAARIRARGPRRFTGPVLFRRAPR